MNMESIYEYGTRAGFWRLWRLFNNCQVPVTVYGVAMALERTPEDGQVRVSVRNEGTRVVLHVQDGGREEGEETEVEQALAACTKAGMRLIDEQPRTGIRNSRVAFLHPASTGGVLTEIVQPAKGHADE